MNTPPFLLLKREDYHYEFGSRSRGTRLGLYFETTHDSSAIIDEERNLIIVRFSSNVYAYNADNKHIANLRMQFENGDCSGWNLESMAEDGAFDIVTESKHTYSLKAELELIGRLVKDNPKLVYGSHYVEPVNAGA